MSPKGAYVKWYTQTKAAHLKTTTSQRIPRSDSTESKKPKKTLLVAQFKTKNNQQITTSNRGERPPCGLNSS